MISRPRNIISFLIVSVFLFVVPANAFEGKSTKEVLDNGMTVVVSEIPTSPVVAVYALVKAGSATEGEFLGSGITHYLEHMLFQETTNRGVGEIAAQIQAVGGNINASTGMDSTVYKIEVPFDQFDIGLDIMADMLMNTVFSEEELTKERDVVLSEMQLHNDNPSRRLAELTFKTMYLKHPYGHPTIGYKPLFTAISKEDVEKYYHQYYGPNNIVLAIAGNINADDVLPKIRETFKDFERRPEIMRNLPVEPLQISPRFYEEEYATPIARMSLAYGSVGLLDEDLYPLDVLAKILGDGASSRLYRELYKKKKLVQYISASNYTPMDRGVFWISTVLDYNNMDATIEAISSEIEKIKQKGVLPSELEKARAQVLADHVFGSQTAESVAYSQALDEAYTGDHLFANKYLEGIRRVTNDDVVRVAKKYLKEQSRSVVVLKPKGLSDQKDEVSSAIAVGDMEKYVLDNGLTVLLRVNKTFPLVAVRLSLNGGIRQEAPELNGVSNLTASLWTKGTKKKSADQIAEYTESLGMSLGAFSGKNSFGLSIDFLSEYFDQAMDLFEDVVKNPVFPQDELDLAKEQVKTAIRQKEDNIAQYTAMTLKKELFQKHPFRYDDEGTLATVDRISRDHIKEFYAQLSAADNMVISVVGDIDPQKTLETIRKKFGKIPAKDIKSAFFTEKDVQGPIVKEETMDKEQAIVMFGFHGVALDNPDRYPLEVLTEILGSSFSGRFFVNIREKYGDAYTMGAVHVPGPDLGFIYMYVLTKPGSADKVKMLMEEEIADLQNVPVSDEELDTMKVYLKGRAKASLEKSSSVAFTTSLDELYGLGYDYYKQYDALIDAVTKEDVQAAAQKYLDLTKSVAVITRPPSKESTP